MTVVPAARLSLIGGVVMQQVSQSAPRVMGALAIGMSLTAQRLIVDTAQAHQSNPNVVFILGDNVGYGDVGCYGGGQLRGRSASDGEALYPRCPSQHRLRADRQVDRLHAATEDSRAALLPLPAILDGACAEPAGGAVQGQVPDRQLW
jgi:hypothetical protein